MRPTEGPPKGPSARGNPKSFPKHLQVPAQSLSIPSPRMPQAWRDEEEGKRRSHQGLPFCTPKSLVLRGHQRSSSAGAPRTGGEDSQALPRTPQVPDAVRMAKAGNRTVQGRFSGGPREPESPLSPRGAEPSARRVPATKRARGRPRYPGPPRGLTSSSWFSH